MDPDVPARQLSAPLSYDIDGLLRRVDCPVRLVRGNAALGAVVTEEDSARMRALCRDYDERYEARAGHGVHRRPVQQHFAADVAAMAALVP